MRNGKVFHDRDFGGKKSDSNPVVSLKTNADGSLQAIVNFGSLSRTNEFALIKASDGRIRAMFNRNVDTNEFAIKDGKFTANGNVTPWQTRCR
jgi:hypothetical protein